MSEFSDALNVSASGLKAQAQRMRIISENVANVDTPGFKRKTISFESNLSLDGAPLVETGPVRFDSRDGQRIYDPSHPMADPSGNYTGSNVDLVLEIADAREAQRSYDANLKMFDQVRQMSSSLIELLRK